MLVPLGLDLDRDYLSSAAEAKKGPRGTARDHAMGKDKVVAHPQQHKMDKYTTPAGSRKEEQKLCADNVGTDRFAEVLDAIQASRRTPEEQIGGFQAEVGLVRQDLRNVVDKVTEMEGRLLELEGAVKELRSSVQHL